ncbi:MAG: family 43 glycosylhydrolase, partial [Prevotella sp.]|nr:family 43 glycosylhydrolase [Prevotella sp.]
MKHFLSSLSLLLLFSLGVQAQSRVSVHDPSIVDNGGTYYIFGSHQAWAKSTDMYNWTTVPVKWSNGSSNVSCDVAFNTMKVSLSNGGRTLSNFDAEAWAAASKSGYDISGNLWAPDVIYNQNLGKWCMYLSINGPDWNSSIILLTADDIEGPYVYQAPVVVSGFATTNVDYKKSDLELVIGEQATLPNRYKSNTFWPHAIDPCVFYDQDGNLWMSYGSWLGGIWILQLDENTGLRDYTVDYGINSDGTKNKTQDYYYGKKLAGGNFVSGEASYVEYINGYYYLFVTYGGLTADGGYQMRVFRSSSPDGPY